MRSISRIDVSSSTTRILGSEAGVAGASTVFAASFIGLSVWCREAPGLLIRSLQPPIRPDRLRQGRVAQRPDRPVLVSRSAKADRRGGPPKLPAKAEGLPLSVPPVLRA